MNRHAVTPTTNANVRLFFEESGSGTPIRFVRGFRHSG
jgi:hypothetical protein